MSTALLTARNGEKVRQAPAAHRLILRSFQSPGDVLMLTAAVRDLHLAHPGKFQTDERGAPSPLAARGHDGPFWIVVAGAYRRSLARQPS